MTRHLNVLADPAAVAAAAAERLVAAVAAGGHVALAGGSTPAAAYERAAAAAVEWSGATLWFGDERCVPPDDERSNFAMVARALLERLSGPPPRVRRMEGELGPEEAAASYEQALAEELGSGVPRLDLVLLGLGPDGHCASLFPDSPALAVVDRTVVGVARAGLEPFVPRVTLTLATLNAAREVVFMATGESKAAAAARAFGGAPAAPATPAALVAPFEGSLTVLMDAAAAAGLPEAAR